MTGAVESTTIRLYNSLRGLSSVVTELVYIIIWRVFGLQIRIFIMKRFFRKPGSLGYAPGSLVPVDQASPEPLRLTMIQYGPEMPVKQQKVETISECFPFDSKVAVNWLSVSGGFQPELLKEIGHNLTIHPLTLEDIQDTSQRPKLEDFGRYLFIELNMLIWSEEHAQIHTEQVNIILGENYVVTFQEYDKDVFKPIRQRLRDDVSRLVTQGADYLVYTLIDAIVDHYFIVLENLGEQIEIIEDELISNPESGTIHTIHELKRELILLRKSVWPLREVIGVLERGESALFQQSSLVYLRDVYDHTIQIMDTVETFRDMVAGLLDIYLSSISNRMNEVMKVLTIISTVFIPLSFIVGLYGMNFVYMPELQWKWGYFAVWAVMIVIVLGMLTFFRRKKWF
jgi:magnesium transporter